MDAQIARLWRIHHLERYLRSLTAYYLSLRQAQASADPQQRAAALASMRRVEKQLMLAHAHRFEALAEQRALH